MEKYIRLREEEHMTGAELAAIRKDWGITQEEFGKFFGYASQTISDMERGKKPITESFVKHINTHIIIREIKKLMERLD